MTTADIALFCHYVVCFGLLLGYQWGVEIWRLSTTFYLLLGPWL